MISQIIDGIHIGTIWDAIHAKNNYDSIICVAEFDNFSSEEQHDLMCQNRTILHVPFMKYQNVEVDCANCAKLGISQTCRRCGGYGTVMLSDCKADTKKLSFIARVMASNNISNDTNILIHCAAGVERFPLAVIYYLWLYKNMTWLNAFNYVKLRRPIVENRLFWLEFKTCE